MTRVPEGLRKTIEARVARVVDEAFVYARNEGRSFAITNETLGFEDLKDLGEGEAVRLEIDVSTGIVDSVSPLAGFAGTEAPFLAPAAGYRQHHNRQFELHPRSEGIRQVLDTSMLWPGDLMLTREVRPDIVSQVIETVQSRHYGDLDARWTHAAMYVGDGLHVVEATFDGLFNGGNVRLTRLDEYCLGNSYLRFRRPIDFKSEADGWTTCIRAMSRLDNNYNFSNCIEIWVTTMIRGLVISDSSLHRASSSACICSTLYADAYTQATRRALGECNGYCLPAWLSQTEELKDIEIERRP